MTSPLEDLLRATIDRLQRQEQRTAVLEAALLEAQPGRFSLRPPVDETPPPLTPWPKPDDRTSRLTRMDPAPASPTAVSPIAVLASLDDVVWSVSPDGQLVFFVGGAVERLYGLTEHTLHDSRSRWLDAVPTADRERLRAALARLPDTDSFTLEHRIAHAGGGFRWVVTRGKLVRDREGRPLRVDGITTDTTRQAGTRNAIIDILNGIGPASGSDFFAKLTQHLCGACDIRAALIVEPHANEPNSARVAAAWIGGHSVESFVFSATTPLVRELLSGGRVFAPSLARNRFPTDSLLLQLRAEAFVAEPLFDTRGRLLGFLALADDRPFAAEGDPRALLKSLAPRAAVELTRIREESEHHERDARLADAERRASDAEKLVRSSANLAALGRMAAGLAHDFNNLLGVIAGNADLIRESLPDDDSHRETADVIARTAQTIAAMNRKLLSVVRPGPAQAAPMDVASAIRVLEPILRRLVPKQVAFDIDLASDLSPISADASQFDRVILNLVLNARDAVEASKGIARTITIRAAMTKIEPNRPGWPQDRVPGLYVALMVVDTGCGMSADVCAKMFDRFFTTKGDSGTGIGLATVLEIVRTARGHIEVESEPAWGTQVRVYWPALVEVPGFRAA